MLLQIGYADAYGHCAEYNPRFANDLTGYRQHPTHLRLAPGQYTDDTQHSVAVAQTLLDMKLHSKFLTRYDFAFWFLECFKRDPRDGYARGYQKFLEEVHNATEYMSRIRPDSEKSGAAMRSVPLGLLPTKEAVKEVATIQASVTHNTKGGITSSVGVALSAWYLRNKAGPLKDLQKWLSSQGMPVFEHVWHGKVGIEGMQCALAAIFTVTTSTTMLEVLKRSVDWGGDTDTVAAIACGLASLTDEIVDNTDEKPFLLRDLENGAYGRDYLIKLDKTLFAEFPVAR